MALTAFGVIPEPPGIEQSVAPGQRDDATQPDVGDTLVFDDRHAFDLAETVRAHGPTAPIRSKSAKQKIGPFEVKEILGCGGMGVVYAAVTADGSRAAVKVLSARPSPKDALRFAREASVAIDHENVVKLLEARLDGDTPYIAFELLEGRDLQQRLRDEVALSPKEAAAIGVQVGRGLVAAHRLGVIHRDLKPANIFLLANGGGAKVLDFGIAYIDDPDSRLTSTNALMGTPHYMAPEQARGEKSFDARTDVWGLGAVLYHALTGQTPFPRETRVATLLAVATERPHPIAEVAPTVPAELALIVERALAKDRADRWPSMEAMLAALESLGPLAAEIDPSSLQKGRGIAPGEQRIVAVLMARGVFDAGLLVKEVEARGGLHVPLVGGQVIALFGVEEWRGDEIERAVEAGLAVRPFVERVAVASGRVAQTGAKVSGNVVRSAELCCDAELDHLALDPIAARAVAHLYVLREAHPDVFEVQDRKPKTLLTTQLEKLESGAPIFGRDAELAQIGRVLRSVIEDRRARAVVVMGPVGIGKRRLCQEVMRQLETKARGARMLHARAQPDRETSSFSLFRSMFEERAEIGASIWGWPRLGAEAPLGERQHAVMRIVDEAIGNRREAALSGGFLGKLLGIEMPENPDLVAARGDHELMQDRIRIALADYLAGLTDEGPVGLFVEEVQWADSDSMALLAEIVEQGDSSPLFVMTSSRPEIDRQSFPLIEVKGTVEIDLEGLDRLDVKDFAKWIAKRPIPDPVVDLLHERTGGNPLFIEQITAALVAEGRLDDPGELPLPLTVEAAVQSRVDQLDAQEKDACRRCSIFGRPFYHHEAAALGVPEAPELLKRLVEKKILTLRRNKQKDQGAEFRFRSTLIQDVVYGMIVEDRRKPLHARAASFLAQLPDTEPDELARHLELSGDRRKASLHYARAAFRAASRGDSRKVDAHSRRALDLGAPPEAQFDLAMVRAEALQFLGRHADRQAAVELAMSSARSDSQKAQALTESVKLHLGAGRIDEALATAGEAVTAATAAKDSDVLVLALGRQGLALTKAGRLDDAEVVLGSAENAAALAPIHLRALIAGWRGQLAGARGDLEGRLRHFLQAVELYARAGDHRRRAAAKVNVADVYNRLGDYARADAELDDALDETRRVHNRVMEGYALVNKAYALTRLGRTDEALRILTQAAAVATAIRDQKLELYVRYYRVRAKAGGADTDRLAEECEVIAKSAESRFVALAIGAFTQAAALCLEAEKTNRALELSHRAIELLQRVGGVEEDEAEVYLTRAAILRADGRGPEADGILDRGRERLAKVSGAIQDRALRQQLLEHVAAHRALMR
jgi:tetratricopeptide (TPR) repeat protein